MEDFPRCPQRWSLIPFNILADWETSDKRRRFTARSSQTHVSDLPEPILAVIFSLISDPRTRNSMAVVCTTWYSLERATRISLCLRGSVSELFLIPRSFQSVERLNLSQCSPWGNSLFQSVPERAVLVGQVLKQAFPKVKDMTIYVRDSRDIEVVACFWPELVSLKLVRWHQRPMQPEESCGFGMEFRFLMQNCKALRNLDLSQFYCWTEDIPPALEAEPSVSRNLRSLNLLKVSVDGFKALELEAITNACTNLEELRIVLVFDPRFLDFVGDSALVQLASNCTKLRILHLVDGSALEEGRRDPSEGFSSQDAQIGREGLVGLFERLPLLEDLAFVLLQDVRNSGPALETLASHCKRLRSLRLVHFHGICRGPQPDGVALCSGLKELVIESSADLSDVGLVAIATGCTGLRKLGLQCCKDVSKYGCRALTSQLSHSLLDVEISCCLQMNAVDTLWALHPIQASIQHLHLDCIWDADLVKRELDRMHKPSVMDNLKVWESKTRKEFVGSSAKRFTGMDSFDGAKMLPAGGMKDEYGERSKSADSLDLNFLVTNVQVDSRGHCSTHSMQMEKLKDASCDGWLTLSRTSSAEDISGRMMVLTGTEKDSGIQQGRSEDLGFDPAGEGTSELLPCGSGSLIVSPSDPGPFWLSLDHSGNDTKKLQHPVLGDLNSEYCERDIAVENGNPNPGDESFTLKRWHESPLYDLFTSGQECVNPSETLVLPDFSLSFREKVWGKLKSLSLWIPVGEVLSSLPIMGLQICPLLQEIRLKVEGDSRLCLKPQTIFGIATFASYPAFSKLVWDCSQTIGYALSAPPGHMELSLWDRWYFQGIQTLRLEVLDYRPPQDRDTNRRGISLPVAGLISQCPLLRELILHGTINEHFLLMFLHIPNLRDVQLPVDYYPAPEVELNTEMRTEAFKRFEVALAKRSFPD